MTLAAALATIALAGCGQQNERSLTRLPAAARVVEPASVAKGSLTVHSFYSHALGRRTPYDVYLPPGYAAQAAAGRRFPVLYVLHSPHAIPFGAFRSGAINVAADELLQRHAIRPMIIVVPLGTTKAFGGDSEWTDTPGAGRFDAYVVDVAHMIDRRYATLADRRHRALSGLSMGGYGAVNIALHHLKLFSVAESWSGYFTQTPTGPFVHATRAELAAASPAHVVPALAPDIRRRGLRLWLYQGNHDDVPVSAMRAFAREVRGAGATVRADVYRGGHNWGLWRPRVPRALILASAWFAQPPHR